MGLPPPELVVRGGRGLELFEDEPTGGGTTGGGVVVVDSSLVGVVSVLGFGGRDPPFWASAGSEAKQSNPNKIVSVRMRMKTIS